MRKISIFLIICMLFSAAWVYADEDVSLLIENYFYSLPFKVYFWNTANKVYYLHPNYSAPEFQIINVNEEYYLLKSKIKYFPKDKSSTTNVSTGIAYFYFIPTLSIGNRILKSSIGKIDHSQNSMPLVANEKEYQSMDDRINSFSEKLTTYNRLLLEDYEFDLGSNIGVMIISTLFGVIGWAGTFSEDIHTVGRIGCALGGIVCTGGVIKISIDTISGVKARNERRAKMELLWNELNYF